MITQTGASPHARMTSVPAGAVTLAPGGPLGSLYEQVVSVTIPSMGDLMFDPAVAHAVENFRVAAGLVDGEHHAAPFMDGDLFKWLEAAVVAGQGDEQLVQRVADAAEAILAAQRPDGYLHTKVQINSTRNDGVGPLRDRLNFETYNLGHLMTLGCLHRRLTGEDTYFRAALNAVGYLTRVVDEDPEAVADCNICPSHYMGVIEVYRTTGNPEHLRLAGRLLELHGGKGDEGDHDNQDVHRVQDQRVALGHAVRANYLFAGMTDYVLETGDPAYREAVEALWEDVVGRKLYITGGCGALYDGAAPDAAQDYSTVSKTHQSYGRAYQLPHTTAYNESCATIGFVLWSWRMLALTGQARYADEIERVLFNSLPAMIDAAGTSYFYTNPLRAVRDLPYEMRRAGDPEQTTPPASDHRLRQEYMTNCFCCPPNIARIIAELPYLVASTDSKGIWLHQYVAGSADLTMDGVTVRLTVETNYPTTGEVRIRVQADTPVSGHIRVRVPGWAPGTTVSAEGGDTSQQDGYVVVSREWTDAEIHVSIPLRPRLMVAHHFVEENTNQVAVMRGPVVYCLESADLPPGTGIETVHIPTDSVWQESPGEGVFADHVVLRGDALRLPCPVPTGALYGELVPSDPEPLPVTLVPYARWANSGPGEMSVWLPLTRSSSSKGSAS